MRSFILGISLLLTAITAQAGSLSITGNTSGGPTWNRPVAGAPPVPPLSGVGTAVHYTDFAFSVDLGGTYSFLSVATQPQGWDNYTFLYANAFDANAQFANVLIGNDDAPTIGSSGFDFALVAGTVYHFVVTGFANSDAGAYTTRISGEGNITPRGSVPEPASLALLAASLAALATVRRRRAPR